MQVQKLLRFLEWRSIKSLASCCEKSQSGFPTDCIASSNNFFRRKTSSWLGDAHRQLAGTSALNAVMNADALDFVHVVDELPRKQSMPATLASNSG